MPSPMKPSSAQSRGGRQEMTVRMLGTPKTWTTWPWASGLGGTTWLPMVQLKPAETTLRSPTHPRW